MINHPTLTLQGTGSPLGSTTASPAIKDHSITGPLDIGWGSLVQCLPAYPIGLVRLSARRHTNFARIAAFNTPDPYNPTLGELYIIDIGLMSCESRKSSRAEWVRVPEEIGDRSLSVQHCKHDNR